MTRAALAIAIMSATWAAAVTALGGFDWRIAGVGIQSHDPLPAVIVAFACLALLAYRGLADVRHELDALWITAERRATALALVVTLAALLAGLQWGTYVAGGADSYCYLNQAELLARGRVRDVEPLAFSAPWPEKSWSFVPTGHVPSPGPAGEFVPMCAAGYPLIMAVARTIAGRTAMFWVVPLMGALAVWLTFVLARRMAGPVAGLMAAALLATSPTFLYQVVQPMTDVPTAALWTLALVATPRPWLSGIAAGAALLVRPNLAPLVAITAFMSAQPPLSRSLRSMAAFGAGVLPFFIAVLALNNAMYGAPLKSGYGQLDALFAVSHIVPNLARYPAWLLRTETPFVLLAFAAPWLAGRGHRRTATWLLAFAAATFGCYLAYEVFNDWWYLRFVLPAFPPLLVLASAAFIFGISRFTRAMRTLATGAAVLALSGFHLAAAVDGQVFRLRSLESRFREGGEYVAQRLPENAAIVTFMQSGSVRFYSDRPTLVWTAIEAEWLDRALDFLRAEGRHPYLLFERDEEEQFRRKFDGHSRLGSLEWPPLADINREVKIYDPDAFDVYRRGGTLRTERLRTRW